MAADLPTSPQKKYWAFISYSSKDRKWGKWLHSRLENYPIPKEFQGTRLFDGAVLGKDLKPCFRDRDELSGSADLGPAIFKALNQSRYLIVLCSKNSAKSEWVNKEIEDFKDIGGERKILALILDGEPNASSNDKFDDSEECFPPALRYPSEPLAGDMRNEGDGKERGFLKILSGIAQLDFDVLYRRHERAQRKKRLVLGSAAVAVISALTLLSIIAISQKGIADEQKAHAEVQTKKVKEAKVKQDSLLLEASMGDHEAATRAFEEGKYNEGLAYLARAIRLKPDNDAPQIMALNHLVGPASPVHSTRWIAKFEDSVYPVSNLEFSPDGNLISTTCAGFLAVKESATGKEVYSRDFEAFIHCVAFSPDGRWLCVGGWGVTVIQAATGKEVSLRGFIGSVKCVAFSPDSRWIACGSADNTVHVIEAATGKEVSSLKLGLGSEVNSVAFSPDGRWVAAGSGSRTARVIEAATGKQIYSLDFRANASTVSCVSFSPDGHWLACSNSDYTVCVIEAATGKEVSSLKFGAEVSSVAFSPDGRWVAAGSWDRTARVIEAATGKEISSLEFGGRVNSVGFSPDGRWLAAGSMDETMRVIDAATGKQLSSLEFGETVNSVAFSPDGRWLAAGIDDMTARVIEVTPGREVSALELGNLVDSVAYSPDSRWIAVDGDEGVLIIESATGNLLSSWKCGRDVRSVAFSPDGRWLATAGGLDDMVRVIEVATGKQISSRRIGNFASSVAFSPDGRWLVAGSWDNNARVIEAATGNLVSSFNCGGNVASVAFSPDGRWLAAGSDDRTARVIEVATGNLVSSLKCEGYVTSVAFSPDGRWLAAGSNDGTARVIEAATGRQISSLKSGDKVSTVAFSPDGRWLAAGSRDNTMHVIEAATGKEVSSLDCGDTVISVAFSPDSRWLVGSGAGSWVIDCKWWDEKNTEGVLWEKLLCHESGIVFDQSGKLSERTPRQPIVQRGKDFFPSPIPEPLKPLATWLHDLPERRMSSPWSDIPLRTSIGNKCVADAGTSTILSAADQAPWHPLVPISLARIEEDPIRRSFLAGLTLNRLRFADPKLWGEETLALYFAKSAVWMDEMELGQVALDTAEEALKRNPDDAGVLQTLENIKSRMER